MSYNHRYGQREWFWALDWCRETMGETTNVLESTRVSCYLPPRRFAIMVLMDVPQGVFAPSRTVSYHITYIAGTTGDDAITEVAAVIFSSGVHTTTPRGDEVGAGFHEEPPLKLARNNSDAIVDE